MAAGFDPYHRWLSIPPSEQPPSHYRLLGLQVFESNFEVIENAAVRQSRHVRGHLESPLRPYATNLLREIEVARLCLLDREAKSAYDSCLRQRQEYQAPAKSRATSVEQLRATSAERSRVEAVPSIASAPDFPSEAPISFSETPVPSIHTYRMRGRKRRRVSPLAFLVLWLAGGAMGLLAGYAILCMIDPQYDFLHVMFPEEGRRQSTAATDSVPPASVKIRANDAVVRLNSRTQRRQRRDNNLPTEQSDRTLSEQQFSDTASQVGLEAIHGVPIAGNIDEGKPQAAILDMKPVVLPFDFKKRVLRVISFPEVESFEELRCNIHGSTELHMNPLIDFPLGGKQKVIFNNGLGGVIAGFEISFLRRNKAAIVEIFPKYRLPSGDEEGWYRIAGVKKANLLAKQVSEATNARDALPALRNVLRQVNARIESVSQVAFTPTTAAHTMRQTAAQRSFGELTGQRNQLQTQIGTCESLNENLPKLEADFAAVKLLGEWSAEIAETATLSVCIHEDGTGLVAEAR